VADRLDFSHEPNLTIDDIISRVTNYYPEVDVDLLRRAYDFSAKAHINQKRSSGEPYIIHPLNVVATLVKLKMDIETLVAGFLHDVVEDCEVEQEEIESAFGASISQIVIGLTKISKIEFKSKEESQAENFRKMLVAMAKDLRVIIVKLADRMHNIRTLQYVSALKQQRVAQETLDIYVPLASRLGIHSVKSDLEDLCLRYLHPDIYYKLAEKVAKKRSDRELYITECIQTINEKLEEYSVKAEVTGRSKNFYSIYKKMNARGVDFEQIQDLLAFRILVSNITECYKALGVVHSSFTPIPGRFKDYVAIPKANNYQSLHTTVIGPKAERIEIQIRTYEMHEVAERGIAAHWKYKERGSQLVEDSKDLAWVKELLEFNQSMKNNSEFMDAIKGDLDSGGVFIFTPKGDVIELPFGATPLDFAFAVHTEVGSTCVGAKINGKLVSLKYRLKSGDTIDILTSKTQTPSKDWLKIVKTSRARTKIKQYIAKIERDKNKEMGEQLLEKSLSSYGTSIKILDKKGEFKKFLEHHNVKHLEELFVQIGIGNIQVRDILKALGSVNYEDVEKSVQAIESLSQTIKDQAKRAANKDNAVIVEGIDDIHVRMGKCCNPIPGDQIIGLITKGRGISVHSQKCKKILDFEEGRRIQVDWNPNYQYKYTVTIKVVTHDKPGILAQISRTINNIGINIKSAIAKSMPDQKGDFLFEVEVKDFSEYLRVVSTLESLDEVISVDRA
jgi:guanosine-3',5'-bis(diphosphate) 3'-pyrophosphohydrolase